MSRVHTIQELQANEKKQVSDTAERIASEMIDSISDYNIGADANTLNNLSPEHRSKIIKHQQLISKQPVLVQAEIAKKSVLNEYLLAQLFDMKSIENTQLTSDVKILTDECKSVQKKLEENGIVYDANAINQARIEVQRDIEALKRDLDGNRQKRREQAQAMLLSSSICRK